MPDVIGQHGLVDDSLKVPQPNELRYHFAALLGIMRGDSYGADANTIRQREMSATHWGSLTPQRQTNFMGEPAQQATDVPTDGDGQPTTATVDRPGARMDTPSNASNFQARLLATAQNYLGIPYVYGGTNPKTGLDCSGFVQRTFADMGIALPRVTYDQVKVGTELTNRSQLQPGDLVFFVGDGNRTNGHVAIYMGGDMMIDAPHTGANVGIRRVPWDRMTAMRRVMDPTPDTHRTYWR